MGLLSFLKRNRADDASPAPAKPSRASKASATAPDDVQRARTRARQRLVGAVVLLGIGVIAFPIVFETQPRPIPVDLPIEIPRKDAVPALPAPKPRAASPKAEAVQASAPGLIEERAADAGKEVAAPVAAAPSMPPKAAPEPIRPAAKVPTEPTRDPPRAAPPPAPETGESTRAQALLDDKQPPAKAADAGRFVVQVGAFSEAAAARDTRSKVEKLGLKTYTQVVETEAGRRIRVRVGPFASRDDADKAAGRIRSAGLPSAVLGL